MICRGGSGHWPNQAAKPISFAFFGHNNFRDRLRKFVPVQRLKRARRGFAAPISVLVTRGHKGLGGVFNCFDFCLAGLRRDTVGLAALMIS